MLLSRRSVLDLEFILVVVAFEGIVSSLVPHLTRFVAVLIFCGLLGDGTKGGFQCGVGC